MRLSHSGAFDWGITLFHGYDTRPVFKTTELVITPEAGGLVIDPGYTPEFHKMSSLGLDGAVVLGDWSLRGEAAYSRGRYFNTRQEYWGYPATPTPGVHSLNPNQLKSDTLEYGIGLDYRLFEDCLLTLQAQQTVIRERTDLLYDRTIETILWGNIKTGWMNQKLETNLNFAYNPEHGDYLGRAKAVYIVTDAWKTAITAVTLSGDPHSIFGRFARNDQLGAEIIYSW
jgi:hypothetical protein